jgi:Lipoprotein LpqB beta-propeller domain/Sporulation and spore germination
VPNPGPPRVQMRIPVRVRITVGLAATAVAAISGCATAPAGGAPRQLNTGGNQVQAYVQPLPPPGPKAYGDDPRNVVLAFLHASASFAFDPAATRQFLLPSLRRTWHPGPVTVVSSIRPVKATVPAHSLVDASSAAGPIVSVDLTGQQLATLSQTLQYQYSPRNSRYVFSLQRVNGVWLIAALPPGPARLLLLQADFERVYQARNLFFFARSPAPLNGDLVPDPVYAPLQTFDSALNTNLVSKLVTGLMSDQANWLSDATTTAFPRGTKLIGVAINGQTAVVNLGGAAVRATPLQRLEMVEQLQATLGSTAYSAPLAHFVQLEINGQVAKTGSLPPPIHQVPHGPQLLFQSAPSTISEGTKRYPGPWESASAVTAIAMEPSIGTQAGNAQVGPVAVAATDGNGCAVYLRTMRDEQLTGSYHRYQLSASGGGCRSLSWDINGNVWAAAGRKIWVLVLNGKQQWHALTVALPANLTPSGQRAPQVLALRMAPDGVRAALLIRSNGATHLVLAAAQEDGDQIWLGSAVAAGTGLSDPIAMSWFSPYDLMVLERSGIAEVPLEGAAQPLGPAPIGADSLTTDGRTVAVGTFYQQAHQIQLSTNLAPAPTTITWQPRPATGAIPAYPG